MKSVKTNSINTDEKKKLILILIITNIIGLEQKFVAFFSSKISIF